MAERNESMSINTTNNAPYLSADRSELAPLYSNPQENKGLRTIISFFTVFTIFITVVLAVQLQYGDHQVVPHGSVVTDSLDCSAVGAFIIKSGGNAVDAAIASKFCMGVTQPYLSGLGGGGLMLIYDQRQRRIRDCLDFRVVKSRSSITGVPGLVAGLYQAHLHHGVLSWKEIIMPSVLIARNGFVVSDNLISARDMIIKDIDNSSYLYSWLLPLRQNQTITNLRLADTLEAIANDGPDVFYKGNLTEQLVAANLSLSDLNGYNVLRGLANNICNEYTYNGYKVILPSHGSGGPFVANTLDRLNFTHFTNTPIADVGEALLLGNNSEGSWPLHSGSVVVATDRNDLYVSVVSSLGSVWGAKNLLPAAGFILNNAIDIASFTNDRVVSLSVPFIAVDSKFVCGRRLISGAADARDAIQLLYRLLSSTSSSHYINSTDVDLVVESPRVRFTYSSSSTLVWLEDKPRSASPFQPLPSKLELDTLQKEGFQTTHAYLPYPSLNVIQKTNDLILSHADSRGEGAFVTF